MADPTSDTIALTHLIGEAMSTTPSGTGGTLADWIIKPDLFAQAATRAAEAVEQTYLLIPRTQLEDITHDYELPIEFVEDAAAVESFHVSTAVAKISEAAADGLLIVVRPETHRGPTIEAFGMVPFRLRLTGWRLPDQDPPDPADPDACPHCGATLARCMLVPCATRQTGSV